MQLSKLENLAYEELKKSGLVVFRIKDLVLLLKLHKTKVYNLIKALKRKEAIRKVGKGFFALPGADEFVVATNIHYPSYISFWTALNYYGLSDNLPKKIFLVTTKYTRPIGNFKYVALSQKRFFGYTSMGNAAIAEREKAIIDSLLFPKYSGGVKEVMKCVAAGKGELSVKKLIHYAERVESKVVLRRLGFILQHSGFKGYDTLKRNRGRGYVLLDPNLKRKNNFNKEWLLDINI